MVCDIKAGLTYNARLVYDGSRIAYNGFSTRATIVRGVSVRLLDIITDSQNLELMTIDIGNAFIQVHTQETIYIKWGPEFGDRDGFIVIILRALYDLTTSSERFRIMLIDLLCNIDLDPTYFGRDVYMMKLRYSKDGCDYICNHVDSFKAVAKNLTMWIDRVA